MISRNGPLIGYGNNFLTVRAVKLFANGARGRRRRAMIDPYPNDPSTPGRLFIAPDTLTAMLVKALGKNNQEAIDASGDRAKGEVLDSYAAPYQVQHGHTLRNRVEHDFFTDPPARLRTMQVLTTWVGGRRAVAAAG